MTRSRQKTLALEELTRTQEAFDALHRRSTQMVKATQKDTIEPSKNNLGTTEQEQDENGSINDAHRYRHRRGGR